MGVSSKSDCGNLCQCQVNSDNSKSSSKVSKDNLFSPIKNKMKVLKKIKKRMGLGTSSNSFVRFSKGWDLRHSSSPVRSLVMQKKKKNLDGLMIRQLAKKMPQSFSWNLSPNPVAFYLLTSVLDRLSRRRESSRIRRQLNLRRRRQINATLSVSLSFEQ